MPDQANQKISITQTGPTSPKVYDLLILGGGISGCLFAYRLNGLCPHLKIRLVEETTHLGGGRVSLFRERDVREAMSWLRPLVTQSWPHHRVEFFGSQREVPDSLHCVRSETLHSVVLRQLGDKVKLNAQVISVGPEEAVLAGGERLHARVVIDARGRPDFSGAAAFVKAFGLDLTLSESHGLKAPTVDFGIGQGSGLRCFRSLPTSDHSVWVEELRYSETPDFNPASAKQEVLGYALRRGWRIEEEGEIRAGCWALPLSRPSSISNEDALVIGSKGGLLHPASGCTLTEAARLVDSIVKLNRYDPKALRFFIQGYRETRIRQHAPYRILNRILFRGLVPERRCSLVESLYRLPYPALARYEAGALTYGDALSILLGGTQVSLGRAIACLFPGADRPTDALTS